MGWDAEDAEAQYWEDPRTDAEILRDSRIKFARDLPYPHVAKAGNDMIKPARTDRIAELRRLVEAAREEISALEAEDQIPVEPGMNYGVNPVIRFGFRYNGGAKVYRFIAIRLAGSSQWWLSGNNHDENAARNGWEWRAMWTRLLQRGSVVGAVEVATGWAHETGRNGVAEAAYSTDPADHKIVRTASAGVHQSYIPDEI